MYVQGWYELGRFPSLVQLYDKAETESCSVRNPNVSSSPAVQEKLINENQRTTKRSQISHKYLQV